MKHIETAAIKRLSSAKKKELETLNEQLDTLMEASRRVTSMPKKAEMKAQIQSLKDRMRHLKEQSTVQTAGAWPKDFFTALCKASKTSENDDGSFTEKKASTSTRGHYDGAAVDQGTFATRWLPILKTNRNLIKHDLAVEVLHPTKPDKSFGDIDRQVEHVHLIHGFCLKAGKALKIKVAKNAKEFLALAKEQKPVVIVIPHPQHGFEILMSQEADKQAWKK